MSPNEIHIPFVYEGNVYAAAIILPIVAASVITLRLGLRAAGKAKIGIDDWLALAALFPVIGMGICLIYGTAKGAIGHPSPPYPAQTDPPILAQLYETTPEQDIVFTMDWIIWVLMIPGNGLIKLSALFLYRRIFVVQKGSKFDMINNGMIVLCALWTISFFFAQIFGCGSHFDRPFGALADVASCDTNARLDALMITDLITDIFVWFIPIPMVWILNMTIGKKLAVTGVLCLAAISLAAAIVRLIVQTEISNGGYAAHTDVNLTLTILLYWSMLESGLALIACCLPTLHYLVARTFLTPAIDSMRKFLSTGRSQGSRGSKDGWRSKRSSNFVSRKSSGFTGTTDGHYDEIDSSKFEGSTRRGSGSIGVDFELSQSRSLGDVESGRIELVRPNEKM